MSKPGFSFGLKKSGPPKPPLASRKKPTPFGGAGDDDGSDDETPKRTVAITELDFDDAPAPSLDDDDGFSKKKSNKLKPGNNPLAPPSKVATAAAVAAAAPPPPPSAAQFNDLSSALTSRKFAQAAEDVDPTIYDYDGVYDSFKAAKAKPKPEDDPANKRPKYFDALQKAADQRERDRQIAEEKRLKREREAEGDEFADKEKFVTEAYKRQLEENRRLEEAEKKREEEEAKKNKNRGMADFYKQMLDREEKEHAAQIKAAEELLKSGAKVEVNGDEEDKKSATERAKEINARGGNVLINDDGEVVDKRQLLKGGLNVAPKKKMEVQQENSRQQAAASSRGGGAGGVSRGAFAGGGGKQAMRERQTRMLEAQLEETLKRSRQEEAEETAKIELASKSRKTEADISSAKERYLARKKAAEEAKKNGLADGPP